MKLKPYFMLNIDSNICFLRDANKYSQIFDYKFSRASTDCKFSNVQSGNASEKQVSRPKPRHSGYNKTLT